MLVPRWMIRWTLTLQTHRSKVDPHPAGPCPNKECLFASSLPDLDTARWRLAAHQDCPPNNVLSVDSCVEWGMRNTVIKTFCSSPNRYQMNTTQYLRFCNYWILFRLNRQKLALVHANSWTLFFRWFKILSVGWKDSALFTPRVFVCKMMTRKFNG